MNKISIIIPCYNEEESLPFFYKETKQILDSIPQTDYEFIFIDDGSRDHTLAQLRLLAKEDIKCRYISFSRNFGKESAMYAGLKESTGNFCVIMDADLQHPPTLLPQMYEVVQDGLYDCCGGKRMNRTGENPIRSILSRAFYTLIQKMTHMDMGDGYGDFRMMNRTMVDAILEMKEYNRYMKGVFSFIGFQTKWIPFDNVERIGGKTKWGFVSLLRYAFEGILSFSTTPLKLPGIISLLLFIATVALGIGNIVQIAIWGNPISTLHIILIVVMFLSSLQMLFIYILGAYLSKDYLENKRRPIYIVRERVR